MFQYENTPLENWIEKQYLKNRITKPEHLNIFTIADKLNIWVYFQPMNSHAIEINGMTSIVIDNRQPLVEQWMDFLHELCHVLRHVGNQSIMADGLLDLQEEQTNHFILYASMPYFMIKELELPSHKKGIIELFVTEFNVPEYLAAKRLEQIIRRDLQVRSHQKFVDKLKSQYRTYDPLDPSRWSNETARIMGQLYRQLAAK